jgi:hypothetical protein
MFLPLGLENIEVTPEATPGETEDSNAHRGTRKTRSHEKDDQKADIRGLFVAENTIGRR